LVQTTQSTLLPSYKEKTCGNFAFLEGKIHFTDKDWTYLSILWKAWNPYLKAIFAQFKKKWLR
jgi:hypothetical protein